MKRLVLIIVLTSNAVVGFGQNLITNSTFADTNFQINCQNWYDACGNELIISCDTTTYCQVSFFNSTPTFTDVWSLQLEGGFPQEGIAETYITGQSGTKVYQLKYNMKSDTTLSGDYSTGFASIGTGSQNQFTASKTLSDTTSIWKQFSFTDTLTTQATDTISVRLSAGICDFCINIVYFDLIELTIIDTQTAIEDVIRFENGAIQVYPNPSKESITIEITDSKNENHMLTVYSSTGQLIKTIEITTNILTIDNRELASGLYYYQIQKTTDKNIIGKGKIIIE
ncbi:MAG: hypothetical protein COC01_07935 [Bacteroidetes bacterium]|nr:MAG: hypothetical protein COC01_07935 [Bacteroidota bacterium]